MKQLFYLGRWQLSTPILAIVPWALSYFGIGNFWLAAIITNLIGGLLFFQIDKLIFVRRAKKPLWEIQENVVCTDCGAKGAGYRIVEWEDYDRRVTPHVLFRCKECSEKKRKKVQKNLNIKS